MFRIIAIAILPLLSIIWQALTETGGGGGEGSGQSGSGGGGQTGGTGSSGSGKSTGGSSTGQDTTSSAGSGADPWDGAEHDPARAKALIDKLRPYETQAAQLQAKLTDVEGQLAEYQQAGQSELEQANTRVAKLEADNAKLEQEVRRLKVRVWGGEVGILDTEAAATLLKWDELGEDPDEETTKTALKHMAQYRPALLTLPGQDQAQRQETSNQGATNASRGGGGSGDGKPKRTPKLGFSRIPGLKKS